MAVPSGVVHKVIETTAAGAGAGVPFQPDGDVIGAMAFELTAGTVSFVIQGQIDPNAPFVDLTGTITEANLTPPRFLALARVYPMMRVNVSAISGGGANTLRVWIMS